MSQKKSITEKSKNIDSKDIKVKTNKILKSKSKINMFAIFNRTKFLKLTDTEINNLLAKSCSISVMFKPEKNNEGGLISEMPFYWWRETTKIEKWTHYYITATDSEIKTNLISNFKDNKYSMVTFFHKNICLDY